MRKTVPVLLFELIVTEVKETQFLTYSLNSTMLYQQYEGLSQINRAGAWRIISSNRLPEEMQMHGVQ